MIQAEPDMFEEMGSKLLEDKFKDKMSKFKLMWSSRTFWTGIVLFVYFGFVGILHVFPSVPVVNDIVAIFGFILVNYFHVNPSQNYQ